MPDDSHSQKSQISRIARLVSEDDIFRSMTYAAMKVKAGKLMPGEIVVMNNQEFTVAEDEEGAGVTVHMIKSLKFIENLAESKAENLKSMDDIARSEWMMLFLNELKDYLQKWHEIKTISGPGDNLTFSKMVYRWSYSQWK